MKKLNKQKIDLILSELKGQLGLERAELISIQKHFGSWMLLVKAEKYYLVKYPRSAWGEDPMLRAKREFEFLHDFWDKHYRQMEEDRLIHPLVLLPETGALVFEKENAENLKTLLRWRSRRRLRKQGEEIEASFYRAGKWLRRFHDLTREMKPFDEEQYLRLMQNTLTRIPNWMIGSFMRTEISECVRELADRCQNKKYPIAVLHGDFKPANILFSNGHVIGIDPNPDFSKRDAYHDIANFLVMLTLFSVHPLWWGIDLHHAKMQFLKGYFGEEPFDQNMLSLMKLKICMVLLSYYFERPYSFFRKIYTIYLVKRLMRRILKSWVMIP